MCGLLGESTRTIGRRIQELQHEGICVPTRGSRMDIGPGISHKTKIVEMYLDRYDFTDIKRRTRHSSESITRYPRDFARVMILTERRHSPCEIRIITDHSERLVCEYLDLYQRMNTLEHQEMLGQLRAMYQQGKKTTMSSGTTSEHPQIGWRAETMNVPEMMRVKIESSLEKRIVDLVARTMRWSRERRCGICSRKIW